VTLGRRWYLVGYDLDRHDWRTFRVDRLTETQLAGVRFRQRTLPATDAAAFVRQAIDASRTHIEVEVRLRAPATEVEPRVGRWVTVSAVDVDTCLVRMDVDTLDWPVLLLGSLDVDFEVVSPPELVTKLSSVAERFARCAASAPATG
jgi:predicted DNA-binding transcriptional regulator YafY